MIHSCYGRVGRLVWRSFWSRFLNLSPNFSKIIDTKFHENRSNDPQLLQSGRQIGMAKLLVSFPQPITKF